MKMAILSAMLIKVSGITQSITGLDIETVLKLTASAPCFPMAAVKMVGVGLRATAQRVAPPLGVILLGSAPCIIK